MVLARKGSQQAELRWLLVVGILACETVFGFVSWCAGNIFSAAPGSGFTASENCQFCVV